MLLLLLKFFQLLAHAVQRPLVIAATLRLVLHALAAPESGPLGAVRPLPFRLRIPLRRVIPLLAVVIPLRLVIPLALGLRVDTAPIAQALIWPALDRRRANPIRLLGLHRHAAAPTRDRPVRAILRLWRLAVDVDAAPIAQALIRAAFDRSRPHRTIRLVRLNRHTTAATQDGPLGALLHRRTTRVDADTVYKALTTAAVRRVGIWPHRRIDAAAAPADLSIAAFHGSDRAAASVVGPLLATRARTNSRRRHATTVVITDHRSTALALRRDTPAIVVADQRRTALALRRYAPTVVVADQRRTAFALRRDTPAVV
ncbi:hypothetical protein OSH12_00005, partial [Kaistia terrae]|uniref:hypothetical protein n=1 Tax=Kaistia terrae TaxID=537017 RepID=UPI00224FAD1F